MNHKLLDNLLKPIAPYLLDNINEIVINKPEQVWIEDANGWRCHSEPMFTMQRSKLQRTYPGEKLAPAVSRLSL